MAINGAYTSATQVASSTPFDNTVGKGFNTPAVTDTQTAIESTRDHLVLTSNTTATTLNGDLTLTAASTSLQFLTGSATGFSVTLPNATTLAVGTHYKIDNTSNQPVQIEDGSGADLFLLAQNSVGELILELNGTAAGTWIYWQITIATAGGIVNYNTISSTTFTTSSNTDVAITGFSLTPQAGTYGIWYNSENTCTGSGVDNVATIYKGASAITDSLRHSSSPSGSHTFTMSSQTIANFDGSTTCSVKVNTTGTLSVQQRSLLLIRLGT